MQKEKMLSLASERSRADGFIEDINMNPITLGGKNERSTGRGKQNIKEGSHSCWRVPQVGSGGKGILGEVIPPCKCLQVRKFMLSWWLLCTKHYCRLKGMK